MLCIQASNTFALVPNRRSACNAHLNWKTIASLHVFLLECSKGSWWAVNIHLAWLLLWGTQAIEKCWSTTLRFSWSLSVKRCRFDSHGNSSHRQERNSITLRVSANKTCCPAGNERSATAKAKMPQKHGSAPINERSFTPWKRMCRELDVGQENKMQPTNPNARTYVNGTDVETCGYAVTQDTFLKQSIWTVLYIFPLLPYQCTVDCGIWKKVAC